MMLINKILNILKKAAGFKSAPLAISIFWGVAVLMFALTLNSYAAPWAPPTADPPGNNADTPLNVSSDGQTKIGGLILNTGGLPASTGLNVTFGNVVIADLVSCDTIGTDESGVLSCGSGGGGLWTKSGSNLYPTTISDNVGIGTTSPGTRLDVAGDTRTDQLLFGGGSVAYGVPSGYTLGMYSNDGAFFVPVNTGNTDSDLRLYITDDATDRFSIWGNTCGGGNCGDINAAQHIATFRGDGNVGIGTTTPVGKLEVSYLAGQAGINSTGPTGNTHLPWTNGWNYISGDGVIFRDTANAERMRYVASTGRLGIGTTGPAYPLDVNGQMRASRYYDDNTAFYIDSNVTSQMSSIRLTGGLYTNNTGPTLYLQDTNNRSAMVHVNSNTFYVLRGCANNSTIWCPEDDQWPLTINLNTNDMTIAGRLFINTGDLNNAWQVQIRTSADGIGRANLLLWRDTTDTGDYMLQGTSDVNGSNSLAFRIQADGSYWGYGFFYQSDERLKENIKPIDSALSKILQLNGVSYRWKATGESDIGLIAQNVQKIFPEVVSDGGESEDGGETEFLSIDYGHLMGPIVEAIKELHRTFNTKIAAIINEMRSNDAEQDARIKELEVQVGELQRKLEEINNK